MIEIKMTNEQKVHVHLAPKTAAGKDAKIQGDVTYEVTSGDATVDATDNLNPFFVSGDGAVESKILASADADLGEGVETITQEFSVIVSQANASTFGVTVDAPEPK